MHRKYFQAKLTGTVSDLWADRLALRLLGLHPCEVWGNWFDIAAETSQGISA